MTRYFRLVLAVCSFATTHVEHRHVIKEEEEEEGE